MYWVVSLTEIIVLWFREKSIDSELTILISKVLSITYQLGDFGQIA